MKNYISFANDKNDYELTNIGDTIDLSKRNIGLTIPNHPFSIRIKNIIPDDYKMSFHFIFYFLINKNDERTLNIIIKGKQIARISLYNGNKDAAQSFWVFKDDFDEDGSLDIHVESSQIRGVNYPIIAGMSWQKQTAIEDVYCSIPVCSQGFTKSGSGALIDLLTEYDNIDIERSAELRMLLCINRAKGYIATPHRLVQLIREAYLYYERDCTGEEISRIYNDNFLFAMNSFFAELLDCSELLKDRLHDRNFRFPQTYSDQWKEFPFVAEENGIKRIRYVVSPEKQNQYFEIAGKYLGPFLNTFKGKKYKLFNNWAVRCSAPIARKMSGEAKFISVWRDPRDQYVFEAIINKKNTSYDFLDVDRFIAWYKGEVASWIKPNDKNILSLRFEDIILAYEKTIEKVNQFLQIDASHHVYKRMYLIPEESKKTIGIYKEYENHPDIKKISKELKAYLFQPLKTFGWFPKSRRCG